MAEMDRKAEPKELATMPAHFIQRYECGHVRMQCRCADANKTVIVVAGECPECVLSRPAPGGDGKGEG